jgi:SnoaL-like domain
VTSADDWVSLVELLHRFTWAMDRGDTDLLTGMTAERVRFDTHTVTGRPATTQSAADFIVGLSTNAGVYDGLQHIVGNQIVDVRPDGQSAVVRAYAHVSLSIDGLNHPVKRNGVCYWLEAVRGARPARRWLIAAITVQQVWDEPNTAVTTAASDRRN